MPKSCHSDDLRPGSVVAGNLPYNVATFIVQSLLREGFRAGGAGPVARAGFLVQKEVGERLVASPGTKAYGALSVLVAARARCHAAGPGEARRLSAAAEGGECLCRVARTGQGGRRLRRPLRRLRTARSQLLRAAAKDPTETTSRRRWASRRRCEYSKQRIWILASVPSASTWRLSAGCSRSPPRVALDSKSRSAHQRFGPVSLAFSPGFL